MNDKSLVPALDPNTGNYILRGSMVPGVEELACALGDRASPAEQAMREYIKRRYGGGQSGLLVPEGCGGYAEAADLFLSEHRLIPATEVKPMWGRELGEVFAGSPDFIGFFDGTFSVLDFNFTCDLPKSQVGARLNGYQSLAFQAGLFPDSLFAVQFTPDGKYRIFPAGDKADGFRLCLEVWREKNKPHPPDIIL